MSSKVESGLDQKVMDKTIKKFSGSPGSLLGILEELQNLHPNKYLPKTVLHYVSEKLEVPLARIYSVVTFYSLFNLKPEGKHLITICRGTTCHTEGSRGLLDHVLKLLNLNIDLNDNGKKIFLTTEDMKFTVQTVACFGQCAHSPAVEIDGIMYSNVKKDQIEQIIQKIIVEDK